MARRHSYDGCHIKVGEWGTTIVGKDLRHAVSKLDEYTQEKYRLSFNEYIQNGNGNGNGKRIRRAPAPFLSTTRQRDAIDPLITRITRRRWK